MLYAKPGAERKSAMYALYRLSEHGVLCCDYLLVKFWVVTNTICIM